MMRMASKGTLDKGPTFVVRKSSCCVIYVASCTCATKLCRVPAGSACGDAAIGDCGLPCAQKREETPGKLLSEIIEWPSWYNFTVVGQAGLEGDAFVEAMVAIVADQCGVQPADVRCRWVRRDPTTRHRALPALQARCTAQLEALTAGLIRWLTGAHWATQCCALTGRPSVS
jgi:putative lipoic acid-binding regulatory protein